MFPGSKKSESKESGERWGSRIGVILAVAGSAVGLGNFLRFPGNAAQNGGGAFMLPYFISLLVLGIPLCWAEWTMGRYGGSKGFNSSPGIFSVLWPRRAARYFGAIALLIPLIIYMYYVLIEAWCLGYALKYLSGSLMMGNNPDSYGKAFGQYIGAEADGSLFSGHFGFLAILILVFMLNFSLIYRGITKGIESFCRLAMPLMIVLALVVLVRVLTLGAPVHEDQNVITGLGFMWNPQPDRLKDPQVWLAASGQIFFSLSVGFGIIINYSSYLRENDDVVLSGLTSSSLNEFFEVCLGGLITLPAAYIFLGPAVEELATSTFSVGFVAMPNVFANMALGRFFGFLWFFMLFVAAITSSVSMLQPVIAFLEEGFGLKRHASAAILGLISALGCGFIAYFSKGLVALDTMDFWIGTFMIFVLAMFQSFVYGWAFGICRGDLEAHKGAHIRIPWFVQLMLKYVTPVYLLVIFALFCVYNLPSSKEELLEVDVTVLEQLESGTLSTTIRDQLTKKDVELPSEFVVKRQDHGGWRVMSDDEGPTLFYFEPHDDRVTVLRHKPGRLETVLRSPVAISSILLILAVLAFLLLMVHIAGRRWEQEGRFDWVATSDAKKGVRK